VDLHLDDRLLHGRILHAWGERLGLRRYILISRCLADPARAALYRGVAAEAGCEILCLPLAEPWDLPAADEGDFWLTDEPSGALALLERGGRLERLLVLGLRDPDGEDLGDGMRAGPESLATLRSLAAGGVAVEIRPFPDVAGRALPGGGDENGRERGERCRP